MRATLFAFMRTGEKLQLFQKNEMILSRKRGCKKWAMQHIILSVTSILRPIAICGKMKYTFYVLYLKIVSICIIHRLWRSKLYDL